MDLKAARHQNSPADRLALATMMICFLATGALLITTLARMPHAQVQDAKIPSTATTK